MIILRRDQGVIPISTNCTKSDHCWIIFLENIYLNYKKRKKSVSDSEFRSSYNGVSQLKWIDKIPVHFLSNFHDASKISQANRRQKDGFLKEVTFPQIVVDYNDFMGCVDKADMLKSYYEINRKSKKWWQRIFWHFVDVTLVNSFIIYS